MTSSQHNFWLILTLSATLLAANHWWEMYNRQYFYRDLFLGSDASDFMLDPLEIQNTTGLSWSTGTSLSHTGAEAEVGINPVLMKDGSFVSKCILYRNQDGTLDDYCFIDSVDPDFQAVALPYLEELSESLPLDTDLVTIVTVGFYPQKNRYGC